MDLRSIVLTIDGFRFIPFTIYFGTLAVQNQSWMEKREAEASFQKSIRLAAAQRDNRVLVGNRATSILGI